MKRRWRLWLILTLLFVGGSLLHPAVHWRLIGWAKGEAFYQGRPTSYWRWECERWQPGRLWSYSSWSWHRAPSQWENVLNRLLDTPFSSSEGLPLHQGEPEGVPVLIELVESSRGNTRLIAIQGLAHVGRSANGAVAVLRRILWENEIPDPFAWSALREIDPEAADHALADRP
jgi:hypothetical protein